MHATSTFKELFAYILYLNLEVLISRLFILNISFNIYTIVLAKNQIGTIIRERNY
jgi:hypothetical protein